MTLKLSDDVMTNIFSYCTPTYEFHRMLLDPSLSKKEWRRYVHCGIEDTTYKLNTLFRTMFFIDHLDAPMGEERNIENPDRIQEINGVFHCYYDGFSTPYYYSLSSYMKCFSHFDDVDYEARRIWRWSNRKNEFFSKVGRCGKSVFLM